MRAILATLVALLLTACGSNTAPQADMLPGTTCSEPRPQVCTMEYNPVCATLSAGGTKQYASGCNACADDAVSNYIAETCPVIE